MLYEQFGDLKFKYRNREFWCRGYYVDTVGKNTAKIQDYIKHQNSLFLYLNFRSPNCS
ncbi:transposase, partial [Salmonella enterica subsp. enterica serovar Typhi]|uniref:transposase n=1 Tax=Salmonella enterica TaxID=28901 RepID=UPI002AFDF7D4